MTSPVLFQFMPPLLPSEYQALTESIRAHGVQVPVIVDENGAIIDGHHRDQIATELGVACPRVVRDDLTDAEKDASSHRRRAFDALAPKLRAALGL